MNTAPAPLSDAMQSSARILLVDDTPANLQILRQTLAGRDYRLLIAKSGADALTIARKQRPALVLLDIMMPGMDGFEVCRRLKADADTKDIAIIFLSALGETKDKVKGLELGAVDYITKPFDPAEVQARVETHLTIHRLKADLSRRNRELETANRDLEAANERMSKDLAAAARVQKALLPTGPPEGTDFSFTWDLLPCDELAGDSLNLFALDEHHLGLYVLDVSGHGVPSALLSVAVTHSLEPHTDRSCLVMDFRTSEGIVDPSEVAHRLNALYPMDFQARLYFTFVYGVLDTRNGRLRLVNAGHPGPMLIRRGQSPRVVEATGVPIGMFADSKYHTTEIRLQPGDRFYFYSDGLYEERDADNRVYGMERLGQAMSAHLGLPLEDSIHALVDDIVRWRGNPHLRDDVTVLALDYLGG